MRGLILLTAISWLVTGCTSYPLRVCVSQSPIFKVILCDEGYIEGVYLYHKDSGTGKFITDWHFKMQDRLKTVREIGIGQVPEGYAEVIPLDSVVKDGKYLFNISTSNRNGILFLQIEDGRVVSWEHDSTIDCPSDQCVEVSVGDGLTEGFLYEVTDD